MSSEFDHGIRCDRHIGEAFRVRCADCDKAAAEEIAAAVEACQVRYIPNSSCSLHPDYPLPCNRCARDVLESAYGTIA
jgi:hypothetical protein